MFGKKKDDTGPKENDGSVQDSCDTAKKSGQNGSKQVRLQKSLESNVKLFSDIFRNDTTMITRFFENQTNNSIRCCAVFFEGMIDKVIMNKDIIEPIVTNTQLKKDGDVLDTLRLQVIAADRIEKSSDLNKLLEAILEGEGILFVEGFDEALVLYLKGWQTRAIEEPEGEKVLYGPREGFNESIVTNLTLVRRKLRTKDLKFKFTTLGMRTHTRVCICYIEGVANEKIVSELEKRLDTIIIDGILDSNYISELIRDSPLSPFKTIGRTERPDVVAGKLLEGRIALLVDGTPLALTLPFLFMEYFQSSEDYYVNYYFSIINRLLRVMGSIVTVSVPALYTALVTFHQEMIPTRLAISISAARQGAPLPTIVEALSLLFIFEILRETGTRMPLYIGQALSIVGALVLGQAAVEARFVSAPMVIVVATAGITGLIIPKMKGAFVVIRLALLLLSAFLGLYGFTFGIIGLLLLLFDMRSFGIPYMLYFPPLSMQEVKDTVIRAPWWYMDYRTKLIAARNPVRKPRGLKGT